MAILNRRNAGLAAGSSVIIVAALGIVEGNKTEPYYDIVGVLTVCKGHTGPDIIKNKTYTPAECDAIAAKDLKKYADGVLSCTSADLKQNELDAYTLFATNVGINAYCTSSLLKKLNAGDHPGACGGLMAWNKIRQNGVYVVSQGITNRRKFEYKMCMGENYVG